MATILSRRVRRSPWKDSTAFFTFGALRLVCFFIFVAQDVTSPGAYEGVAVEVGIQEILWRNRCFTPTLRCGDDVGRYGHARGVTAEVLHDVQTFLDGRAKMAYTLSLLAIEDVVRSYLDP